MRKVVLLSALALVAGALLLRVLQHDPGYVLIAGFGKTLEMRLGFAVLMISVALLLLWWMIGLVRRLRHTWRHTRQRQQRRVEKRTQQGLIHYLEGNWQAAEKDLVTAARRTEQPVVHYLAAAQSAYERGDTEKARDYIHQAELSGSNGNGEDLAIALSQARMALLDNRLDDCLAILNRCKTGHPLNPVVLDLLRRVYREQKDWRALEHLLPELEQKRLMSREDLEDTTRSAYIGQLLQIQEKRPQAGEAAAEELQALWTRVPKAYKQDPQVLEHYARAATNIESHDVLAGQLVKSLKQQWSPGLVEMYSRLEPTDRHRQLQQVQKWLDAHPEDAVTQLACARIALRNEMWGPAREHYLKSLQLHPLPQAYAELGTLVAHLGDHEQSRQYYQRGLAMFTRDLPDLTNTSSVSTAPSLERQSAGLTPQLKSRQGT